MKKRYRIISILLATILLFTGCGNIKSNSSSDSKNTATSQKNSADENITKDNKAQATQTPVVETPAPTAGTFSAKQSYSDGNREVSILGLKEYTKLKSDKFKDKAKQGKKFLVLFLNIRNETSEDVYFHVDYLSAKLDGKKITNTVLFNDPEGYSTIFTTILAKSEQSGFIVWEVPENWKKLKITYKGWKDSDGLTLTSTLTPKDLSNPEKH